MPGGIDLNTAQNISVGLGNIVQDVTVTKGKGQAIGSIAKFQIKVSKLPKNKTTKGDESARISMTLKKAGLSAAGLDTEGITNTKLDKMNSHRKVAGTSCNV